MAYESLFTVNMKSFSLFTVCLSLLVLYCLAIAVQARPNVRPAQEEPNDDDELTSIENGSLNIELDQAGIAADLVAGIKKYQAQLARNA